MDFSSGKIQSLVSYLNCTEIVSEIEFEFETSSGQIWESEPGQGFHQESYDTGYNSGYEAGYDAHAEETGVKEDVQIELEDLSYYVQDFPRWVKEQRMDESIFSCDSDIRIAHPYPDEDGLWALWADHDCSEYDLVLTIVMD